MQTHRHRLPDWMLHCGHCVDIPSPCHRLWFLHQTRITLSLLKLPKRRHAILACAEFHILCVTPSICLGPYNNFSHHFINHGRIIHHSLHRQNTHTCSDQYGRPLVGDRESHTRLYDDEPLIILLHLCVANKNKMTFGTDFKTRTCVPLHNRYKARKVLNCNHVCMQ